jgi:hypothetical protein
MVFEPPEETIFALLREVSCGVFGDIELAGDETSESKDGGVGRWV